MHNFLGELPKYLLSVLSVNYILYMHTGLSPNEAASKALKNMAARVHGYGGVIALNNKGDVSTTFTTERMTWAYARDDVLHYGINPGEDFVENVHQINGDINGDITSEVNGEINGINVKNN